MDHNRPWDAPAHDPPAATCIGLQRPSINAKAQDPAPERLFDTSHLDTWTWARTAQIH